MSTRAFVLSCAAASMLAAAPVHAADSISVRLDWSWWIGQSPLLVAKEKGFYEAEGLDVTIQQGQGSRTTTIVVGEGSEPFGHVSLSTAAQSISAGVPITAIAGLWQNGPISLICSGTGIDEPADVVGKRIGSTPTGSDGQVLPAFLASNDIAAGDVSIVNMPGDAKFAAIVSGQVDCISGDDYYWAPQLAAQGKEFSVLRYADWGVTNLSFGLVANDVFLAENPDVVRRFVEATVQGVEYAFANKDEAVEIFLKATGNTQPAEFHKAGLEAYEASLHTQATAERPIGWMETSDWDAMNAALEEFGSMTGRKDASAYFTNDFLPE